MADNNDPKDVDIGQQLKNFKPKKPKIVVPPELLEGANNYDSKVAAIQIISEKEKNKVILIFKNLLKSEPPKKIIEQKETAPQKKPEQKKKSFLGKK
jgi:hypothetical protein